MGIESSESGGETPTRLDLAERRAWFCPTEDRGETPASRSFTRWIQEPTPDPSQEGSSRSSALRQFPSREGLGVGRFMGIDNFKTVLCVRGYVTLELRSYGPVASSSSCFSFESPQDERCIRAAKSE